MINKLGVSEEKLEILEKELFLIKLKYIDESYNFYLDKINIEFLKKMHNYLFCDIYYMAGEFRKDFHSEKELKIIIELLKRSKNINTIKFLLDKIRFLQPFYDGNTRLVIALSKIFKLYLEIEPKTNEKVLTYNSY